MGNIFPLFYSIFFPFSPLHLAQFYNLCTLRIDLDSFLFHLVEMKNLLQKKVYRNTIYKDILYCLRQYITHLDYHIFFLKKTLHFHRSLQILLHKHFCKIDSHRILQRSVLAHCISVQEYKKKVIIFFSFFHRFNFLYLLKKIVYIISSIVYTTIAHEAGEILLLCNQFDNATPY